MSTALGLSACTAAVVLVVARAGTAPAPQLAASVVRSLAGSPAHAGARTPGRARRTRRAALALALALGGTVAIAGLELAALRRDRGARAARHRRTAA